MARGLELHARHEARQARFEPWGDNEVVAGYGLPLDEYQAVRTAVGLVDFSFRDLVQLRGEDRVSFLHGMVTQDVKGLAVGRAAYAALLTAKGAMVADARILHRPDELLLDVEPGRGAAVKEFLERYLVSEDVELATLSGQLALLALRGPGSSGALHAWLPDAIAPEADAMQLLSGDIWAIGSAPWALKGIDLLLPAERAATVFDALLQAGRPLGLRPVGMEALEWLRVEAGLPRYGADMDERTLPLEANLERAIHYQKGCYIGQEVVARATYRGHMNRKLAGLLLGEAQPAPRTELKAGDRKVGWITTRVHSPALGQEVSLGYVHRDFLTPGTPLTLADSGAPATVASLPLVVP